MIVAFPTGLYSTVLPASPSDNTPVTWTISNSPPPNSLLSFTKLPKSQKVSNKLSKIYSDSERKVKAGKLVLSSSSSYTSDLISNKKLYEPGQILEFTDILDEYDLNIPISPDNIITSHDVNNIDLLSLGLSDADLTTIYNESYVQKLEIERSIMTYKISIEETKGNIVETQKSINESDKAIAATTALFGVSSDIVKKLSENKVKLTLELTTLNTLFNVKSAALDALYNKLTTISILVK